jgi:hypothetical protein
VDDALHLQVVLGGRHVVQQDHCAVAPGEELLQRQELPSVAHGVAGEQSHFGE